MRYKNLSFERRSRLSTPVRLGAAAVAACFISVPALSCSMGSTGAAVVNGTACLTQAGSVTTVTNSNGAIIKWPTLSVPVSTTLHFQQPSASSTVLNEVLKDPTAIYGTLSSNGRVWLVNPAGIMVGPGGRVDTAGFVASTLRVNYDDFAKGHHRFLDDGSAQNVINQGEIKTPAGGSVYLIGKNVSNEGIITTPGGETILAAGATVSLVDSATPGVKVDITGAEGNATNLGTITAEAGRIGIAGVIVRNSATLNASSVISEGGRIFLKASQDAYVDGNGRIVTTGTKGGSVEVLGNRVAVMDRASIDASAISDGGDGGRILVGGDYQGKNANVQNAQITYFGPDAKLKANAGKVGAGGTVIVWADDTTRAHGAISARGGDMGGDGGFVEVSGKSNLTYRATADVRAPRGRAGTVLLDPDNISIVLSDSTFTDESLSGSGPFQLGSVYPGTVGATIGWNTIQTQLGLGSLSITSQTGGIDFANGTYGWSNSNALSLYSLGNIVFNGGSLSNSGSGALKMMAGWDHTSGTISPATTGSTGDIQVNNTNISTTSGAIKMTAAGAVNLTNSNVSSGGTLDLTAQSLAINATTGSAVMSSQGNQTIALGAGSNGILQMTSTVGEAKISTNSSQVITFNGTANTLTLQGSNSNTSYGGNSARITSSGTQSITKTSGSLAISLTGGSGTATNLQNAYKDGSIVVCTACATFNGAQIVSSGSQTISATTITVQGGSGGKGNSAQIESKGSAQSITTSGLISVTGGTGAGHFNASVNESVTSDAGIHSDGTQTVNAGSITLAGGGDSATLGGAFLTGRTSQSITTTGNLTMTGGASSAAGQYGLGAAAIIGEETGAGITLNIGGDLVMTGGSGSSSYALIGSAKGSPTINITAANNVTMTAGGSAAKIGVLTGGPAGSLSMTATSGNISQDAVSAINTATLVALANAGSINFAGANLVNTVSSLSANSSVNYVSAKSVHIGSATSTANGVTLSTTGGVGKDLFLGTVTAGSSYTVTANSAGAIYDDNGGANNISAGDVSLTSAYGGSSGGLAISTDISHVGGTGGVTASVTAGSSNGGISIRNSGTALPTINLQSNASAGNTISFFSNTALNLGGFSTFTGVGSDMLVASGSNLDFTSATFTSTGSILLAAGGNLNFAGALSKPTNSLGLVAGGAVNINAGVIGLKVAVAAGTLNVNTTLKANDTFKAVVTGSTNITGGYIKTSAGDLEMVVGGNLNIGNASYGGEIWAGYDRTSPYYPDASIAVKGDLKLNNGGRIKAADDVYLALLGADSTLVLNDGTAGYASSYVLSDIQGAPLTTHLSFTNRNSGGIVIDGVKTTTTLVGGSGFFSGNLSTPARPGAGLEIAYPSNIDSITQVVNDLFGAVKTVSPENDQTNISNIEGASGSKAPAGVGDNSAGGVEGTFGGDDEGDEKKDKKDKKDEKKSNNANDEKKDDKPASKKLAQCT